MKIPSWSEFCQSKIETPTDAVRRVRRGDRVFIGSGCGEPQKLVSALAEMSSQLADTEIVHILNLGVAPYARPKLDEKFRLHTFFIGENERSAVAEARADYTPVFLSDVPNLFRKRRVPLDVALVQVSPPDQHGWCSYGVSVDITKAAAESAETVIAEINPNMPRSLGDSFIHANHIDAMVPSDLPLLEFVGGEETETTKRIGSHVAHLIEDGSTLQMGIGAIPDAVLANLTENKDLGVHTEMFSDGLIDLVESGVVTCERKTIHKGKIIGSFAMGTHRLFKFIDNNPMIEMHPSEYTNDPCLVRQNYKMCAINSALQVDLTGQICADSLGYEFYSGIGGQMDFIRGAQRSEGGKPIICLPSIADTLEGRVSRIVPHLTEGAGVVTTRADVHYVVTEYGVAYLHGKSIRERVLQLISIAHPDYRGDLLEFAKTRSWVYPDQKVPLGNAAVFPADLRKSLALKDGTEVVFRAIKPTDERRMQDLFYKLSEQSVYLRWFTVLRKMPHAKVQEYTNVDYRERMGIVGVIEPEKIIALAGYDLEPNTNLAECAFVVDDKYQNMGLGAFSLKFLAEVAQSNGIRGFRAYVLRENRAMLAVFQNSGYSLDMKLEEDMYVITLRFEIPKK